MAQNRFREPNRNGHQIRMSNPANVQPNFPNMNGTNINAMNIQQLLNNSGININNTNALNVQAMQAQVHAQQVGNPQQRNPGGFNNINANAMNRMTVPTTMQGTVNVQGMGGQGAVFNNSGTGILTNVRTIQDQHATIQDLRDSITQQQQLRATGALQGQTTQTQGHPQQVPIQGITAAQVSAHNQQQAQAMQQQQLNQALNRQQEFTLQQQLLANQLINMNNNQHSSLGGLAVSNSNTPQAVTNVHQHNAQQQAAQQQMQQTLTNVIMQSNQANLRQAQANGQMRGNNQIPLTAGQLQTFQQQQQLYHSLLQQQQQQQQIREAQRQAVAQNQASQVQAGQIQPGVGQPTQVQQNVVQNVGQNIQAGPNNVAVSVAGQDQGTRSHSGQGSVDLTMEELSKNRKKEADKLYKKQITSNYQQTMNTNNTSGNNNNNNNNNNTNNSNNYQPQPQQNMVGANQNTNVVVNANVPGVTQNHQVNSTRQAFEQIYVSGNQPNSQLAAINAIRSQVANNSGSTAGFASNLNVANAVLPMLGNKFQPGGQTTTTMQNQQTLNELASVTNTMTSRMNQPRNGAVRGQTPPLINPNQIRLQTLQNTNQPGQVTVGQVPLSQTPGLPNGTPTLVQSNNSQPQARTRSTNVSASSGSAHQPNTGALSSNGQDPMSTSTILQTKQEALKILNTEITNSGSQGNTATAGPVADGQPDGAGTTPATGTTTIAATNGSAISSGQTSVPAASVTPDTGTGTQAPGRAAPNVDAPVFYTRANSAKKSALAIKNPDGTVRAIETFVPKTGTTTTLPRPPNTGMRTYETPDVQAKPEYKPRKKQPLFLIKPNSSNKSESEGEGSMTTSVGKLDIPMPNPANTENRDASSTSQTNSAVDTPNSNKDDIFSEDAKTENSQSATLAVDDNKKESTDLKAKNDEELQKTKKDTFTPAKNTLNAESAKSAASTTGEKTAHKQPQTTATTQQKPQKEKAPDSQTPVSQKSGGSSTVTSPRPVRKNSGANSPDKNASDNSHANDSKKPSKLDLTSKRETGKKANSESPLSPRQKNKRDNERGNDKKSSPDIKKQDSRPEPQSQKSKNAKNSPKSKKDNNESKEPKSPVTQKQESFKKGDRRERENSAASSHNKNTTANDSQTKQRERRNSSNNKKDQHKKDQESRNQQKREDSNKDNNKPPIHSQEEAHKPQTSSTSNSRKGSESSATGENNLQITKNDKSRKNSERSSKKNSINEIKSRDQSPRVPVTATLNTETNKQASNRNQKERKNSEKEREPQVKEAKQESKKESDTQPASPALQTVKKDKLQKKPEDEKEKAEPAKQPEATTDSSPGGSPTVDAENVLSMDFPQPTPTNLQGNSGKSPGLQQTATNSTENLSSAISSKSSISGEAKKADEPTKLEAEKQVDKNQNVSQAKDEVKPEEIKTSQEAQSEKKEEAKKPETTGRPRLNLKKKGEYKNIGASPFGRPANKPVRPEASEVTNTTTATTVTATATTTTTTAKVETQPTAPTNNPIKDLSMNPFAPSRARNRQPGAVDSNTPSPSNNMFKPNFGAQNQNGVTSNPPPGLGQSVGGPSSGGGLLGQEPENASSHSVASVKRVDRQQPDSQQQPPAVQQQHATVVNTKAAASSSTPIAQTPPVKSHSVTPTPAAKQTPTASKDLMTQSLKDIGQIFPNRRNSGAVKQYARETLLQFQPLEGCMATPPDWNHENLPSVMSKTPLSEVRNIVTELENKRAGDPIKIEGPMPPMRQISKGSGYGRQGSHTHNQPAQKEIFLTKKVNDTKLVKNQDAFKFTYNVNKQDKSNRNKKVAVIEKSLTQKITADLNKLCPENYKNLSKKIKDYEIPNDEDLFKEIINLIFEKALDDDHFSGVYADLCADLTTHNKDHRENWMKSNGLDPKIKNNENKCDIPNFRNTLLRCCQDLYEKFSLEENDGEESKFEKYVSEDPKIKHNKEKVIEYETKLKPILEKMESYKNDGQRRKKRIGNSTYTDKEMEKRLENDETWKKYQEELKKAEAEVRNWRDEVTERENKLKRRRFGNVKFIGELFKRSLLIEKIIHKCCIDPLLKKPDDDKIKALKCLLELTGKRLDDMYHNRKRNNKASKEEPLLESYFKQIKTIRVNYAKYGLSTKSQCFLLDLEDLKNEGWNSQRIKQDGPKMIKEIHDNEKKKQLQIEIELERQTDNNNYGGRNNYGGDGRNDRGYGNRDAKNNSGKMDSKPSGVAKRQSHFNSARLGNILAKGGSTDRKKRGKNSSQEDPKRQGSKAAVSSKRGDKDAQTQKDLDAIKSVLSQSTRESKVTEEEALKKARKVLEDLLPGLVSLPEGAQQWLVDEAIPVKHIHAIMNDRLEDLCMEKQPPEQETFGNFMRYLLKDRKTEMETEIIEGVKLRVKDFMECESWTVLAPGKLWDHIANVLAPLFSKEHCPKVPTFGPKHFKKIISFFSYKDDEFDADFDFRGCFAAALLRRLYEKSVVANEFEIRRFWGETGLHWNELYNSESRSDFFDSLKKKNLKYLYNTDLIKFDLRFKEDFDYESVLDLVRDYHDPDSFLSEFKQNIAVEKIHKCLERPDGLWTPELLSASVYTIMEIIGKQFLKNSQLVGDTAKEHFEGILDNSVLIMCTLDEYLQIHSNYIDTDQKNADGSPADCTMAIQEALEIEILYIAENIFTEVPSNKKMDMNDFMDYIWDVFILSKETIIDRWESERYFNKEIGRGTDTKTRMDMKITLTRFIEYVRSAEDDVRTEDEDDLDI